MISSRRKFWDELSDGTRTYLLDGVSPATGRHDTCQNGDGCGVTRTECESTINEKAGQIGDSSALSPPDLLAQFTYYFRPCVAGFEFGEPAGVAMFWYALTPISMWRILSGGRTTANHINNTQHSSPNIASAERGRAYSVKGRLGRVTSTRHRTFVAAPDFPHARARRVNLHITLDALRTASCAAFVRRTHVSRTFAVVSPRTFRNLTPILGHERAGMRVSSHLAYDWQNMRATCQRTSQTRHLYRRFGLWKQVTYLLQCVNMSIG